MWTTVESEEYRWRAEALGALTCAGPRWISYEPTLGPLAAVPGIAWYIVGGESGPVHRPMELEWLEDLLRGCRQQGAKLFVKQDSGRQPGKQGRIPQALWVQEFPR